MLRADLIRPRLQYHGQKVQPRTLPVDYHYLAVAEALIQIVKAYVGHSRGDLADALREYEGDSLDYPIIRGLASILESRCTFGNEPPVSPAELRAHLFTQGPTLNQSDLLHPLTRAQAIAKSATHYQITPAQVETALFADLVEEQILLDVGAPISPTELISRYNVEIARGILYWARTVELTVRDTYKDLFKFIKLFKLMHTIRPDPNGGYQITLHGPISPFVQSTIRYGLQFAKFMPALLLCESWRMQAEVRPPGAKQMVSYQLDDTTTLTSHFKQSSPFDSQLEADFAEEFEAKYGGTKRVWELAREDELLLVGDTVMIPDFSLTHRKDGRRALLEIVGYWEPDYLRRKLTKIQQAGRTDLIVLLYESANVAEGVFEEAVPGEVLRFSRKPVLKTVLEAVERRAVPTG